VRAAFLIRSVRSTYKIEGRFQPPTGAAYRLRSERISARYRARVSCDLQASESTYVGARATLIQLGQGRMREIHSDEARLVRNFAHVSLLVGTGHPMFKEPVRSNRAGFSLFWHLPFLDKTRSPQRDVAGRELLPKECSRWLSKEVRWRATNMKSARM
jgi:hypothetical protein